MRDGWRKTTLEAVASQYIDGFKVLPDETYKNLGVQWYAGGTFAREPKRGSEVGATRLFRVKPGQFIYNRMFVTEGSFALVASEHADGVVSNEFPVFDLDEAQVLPNFLLAYFQQPEVWRAVADEATGTTKSRRRWKESQFLAHSIILPPLGEQRRIVDLIAAVDDAVQATEAEVADGVRTMWAVIESDLERAEGRTVRLGEVATIVRGGAPRPIREYETSDPAGLPWIKIGDIAADGMYVTQTAVRIRAEGLTKTRMVKPGDFILSNSMSFGRPYISMIEGCIHDGWLALSDYQQSFETRFLYFLLRGAGVQAQFEALAAGSGVRNLKKESVAGVIVNVPSLTEQRDIVERAWALRDAVDAARATADALRALRSNLVTVLLSGEHEIPASYDALLEGDVL